MSRKTPDSDSSGESKTGASHLLSVNELQTGFSKHDLTPEGVVADYRSRIEERESQVQAWKHLDWQGVEKRLEFLTAIPQSKRSPLWGVPIAVKDIFDTVDMPTGYGSEIYRNNRPSQDAACVSRLRAAGALILGKTVSTEFAFWQAGNTRNPINTDHTPGGSSSGSAAAVADFMAPLALGSQTAASTVRPAAYCGVVGFKPTLGLISTAGIKALAGSMDTVGMFARNVTDIKLLFDGLNGLYEMNYRKSTIERASTQRGSMPVDGLSFRIWNEGEHDFMSSQVASYFDNVISEISSLGIETLTPAGTKSTQPLYLVQTDLMAFEAVRELAFEYHFHNDQLSDVLKEFLAQGSLKSDADWLEACQVRDESLRSLDKYFGTAEILIMPSTADYAPLVEQGTGDPIMSRAWTLLGLPSLSLPLLNDGLEMPLGIQLAARPGQDQLLLRVASWLEHALSS